ncbi:MAG: hypothetical protein LKG19_14080, partial [Saprospiraceae bacterium]|nr:hypothetical protein [Saprospiraceae bacterium]
MKNQFNLSISILLLLLLFSILIISCNRNLNCKKQCILRHQDCCDATVAVQNGLTGNASQDPYEIDCADIEVVKAATCLTLSDGIFTFKSKIINNGDDDGRSTAGVILLPPNATLQSCIVQMHKGNHQFMIQTQHCRGKITFCTDGNFVKVDSTGTIIEWISIEVKLKISSIIKDKIYHSFALFAHNQLPDLNMENNYWSTKVLKECLTIEG